MSVVYNGKTIASNPKFHPDLFDWKWSDHILNNPSWVRADPFSEQDKAVYGPAYNHLAADITGKSLQSETVAGTTVQFYLADDGHKVCPVSESNNVTAIYNATGVAWYYIIDTTNEWFKLPRAKHNKYAATLGVVGNGIGIGLTNGTDSGVFGERYDAGSANFSGLTSVALGTAVGKNTVPSGASFPNGVIGLTTDGTNSGIIAQQEEDTDQYKYLYFYVGNFTQTALENTAGLNAELFNSKADLNLANVLANIDFVVERQEPTAANNYTWYRKYKSGWVEQGGQTSVSTGGSAVTLAVTMADANYSITCSLKSISTAHNTGGYDRYPGANDITTTGFWMEQPSNANYYTCWEVKGMAA